MRVCDIAVIHALTVLRGWPRAIFLLTNGMRTLYAGPAFQVQHLPVQTPDHTRLSSGPACDTEIRTR